MGFPRYCTWNAAEFHSVALKRGCERYGIRLEYRPPGRPQFGGHIERYLGTLMRRIHGLPGTTMSNPVHRGKYPSEAKASMTIAELGQWMALEIAGRLFWRWCSTGYTVIVNGYVMKIERLSKGLRSYGVRMVSVGVEPPHQL